MAAVDTSTNNPNDPNNPNNQAGNVNQPGQQTNQPATTGGAGGVTTTGAGNVTGQVVGTANPAQPFQNISSYLAANEPQGKELANQVAGTVTAPITAAQEGIKGAADTFTTSVNQGYNPANAALTSAVAQNPSYVVAENPENVTNFLGQLNNKYTGPTDFTQSPGYSDLQAKIADAQSQAANTQNESGIQTLLNSVEGSTTSGINKLDSLLLSVNPENYKTIQNAGAGATDLLPTLNQTTAAENTLAGQGATTASSTAAAAAKALQDALGSERGNLTDEQNTIQGIVNAYNNSVGIINPTTQTIAQDIQNFLAAYPQLSLSDATAALGPLTNLQSLEMPKESTYASPFDYQTIQALAKLGLNSGDLSGLPISADQSNLAQTFQIPTALQNAIGQAPGVESALNTELGDLGGQINKAVAPFNEAEQGRLAAEKAHADYQAQYGPLSLQLSQTPQTIADPNTGESMPNPAYADLQAKLSALKDASADPWVAQERALAPGLQWVNNAAPAYNDLIQAINAQLGKLGNVGVPTLNYGPNTVTDPVTGVPIGAPIGKDLGNAAAIGIGAGVPAATAAGLLAATAPTTASELAAAGPGAVAGQVPATTGLTGLQAAGPAALAAYGASNIIQNTAKNPLQAGIMDIANTGLSLATLSLPPAIFKSIGGAINSVINSIGDFFGGLF